MENLTHKRDFLFTNRVSGNTVFMLLNQQIGPDDSKDPYIDGARFSEEMYWHKADGKKNVVKINSPGGRVLHGWNIVDSIIETEADTFNTGVAYSMAGILLMFGKHRKAYDFAGTMIHAPRDMGGKKTQSVEFAKGQFKTLLETRTKFTKEEIEDMMTSGKDYFFTAQEALTKGIIDEIVPSGQSLTPPTNLSAKALCAFYNSYDENQNSKEMEYKDILNWLTGKSTEKESVEEVKNMKAQIANHASEKKTLEDAKTILEARVKTLEDAAKGGEAKAKATTLIEAAIKANKFGTLKDEDKTKLIDNAVANYDAAKLMIDAMPSKKAGSAAEVPSGDKGETKTYEWMAKNDPKGLAAIAESDPDLFNKLSDEYNAQPKKP